MTGTAELAVPPTALPQWHALAAALNEHGPAPCEDSGDADAWWPTPSGATSWAVSLCRVCPVRSECAAYAVAAGEREGVWGGLTAAERAS